MNKLHGQDQVMLISIAVLWVGAMAYGLHYGDFGLAFAVGAALAGAALVAAMVGQGRGLSQVALPALGMAMVALAIHVAHGHPESHFAVFAFLAITIVYRRAVPVIVAAGTVAVHHLSFNYFQEWGWGPICFTEPSLMTVIEHAAYVVAQAGVMIFLAHRSQRDFAAGQSLIELSERMVRPDGTIDFSMAAEPTPHPKAEPLVRALREADRALGEARTAARSVHTASNEIAAGNLDLSVRTEQTASSLQLAASSMEQVTRNVQQTAESARTANQLASSAAEVAQRGGSVVEQVVATMGEIQESSRKIADIIGAIDGIAFQTNILALNAAVEAARAGEQGRGFAVVASEVRSLAGRSAEAAKQIKSLIGASVERVENGSRLVADAGSTMTEIVASVQRVNDMIGEITAATGEQTGGMLQINDAVSQLDKMTQRNAAMVEESSAAASSLEVQAKKLAEVVGRFKLTSDRASGEAAPQGGVGSGAVHSAAKFAPKAPTTPKFTPKAAAGPTPEAAAVKPAPRPSAAPKTAAPSSRVQATAAAAPAAALPAGIELWPSESPAAAAAPSPAPAAASSPPPAALKAPTLTDEWETF